MSTHTVKLLRREEVAEGTMSFYFDKPANFQFKPGQYVDCSLIDPPETDAEGNIRTFSIASAPAEKDLMVATRMRDTAFKRVLKTMPLGTQLKMDGPLGSFTLHSNVLRPAVFLAGGIGITPFRSMIINAVREGLARPVVLFANWAWSVLPVSALLELAGITTFAVNILGTFILEPSHVQKQDLVVGIN
jgi:ferredoxin-NADP reductase